MPVRRALGRLPPPCVSPADGCELTLNPANLTRPIHPRKPCPDRSHEQSKQQMAGYIGTLRLLNYRGEGLYALLTTGANHSRRMRGGNRWLSAWTCRATARGQRLSLTRGSTDTLLAMNEKVCSRSLQGPLGWRLTRGGLSANQDGAGARRTALPKRSKNRSSENES
jgi:hypothetical protein